MSSRELILGKIKASLQNTSHLPDDPDVEQDIADSLTALTPPDINGLAEQFRKELDIVSGEFLSAATEKEATQFVRTIFDEAKHTSFASTSSALPSRIAAQLEKDFTHLNSQPTKDRKTTLATAAIGIVDVAYAIADTGTLVVSFQNLESTLPHFLPDVIIALVYKEQLIANQFELFEKIDPQAAKNMVLVTGPSRTADIEKILILGAHGPRRLVVIMIDNK